MERLKMSLLPHLPILANLMNQNSDDMGHFMKPRRAFLLLILSYRSLKVCDLKLLHHIKNYFSSPFMCMFKLS